jgi:hypothetical protein
MKKLILLAILSSSCSTTYIDARTLVIVQGENNTITVTGSELKDNTASQESKPVVKAPLIK